MRSLARASRTPIFSNTHHLSFSPLAVDFRDTCFLLYEILVTVYTSCNNNKYTPSRSRESVFSEELNRIIFNLDILCLVLVHIVGEHFKQSSVT